MRKKTEFLPKRLRFGPECFVLSSGKKLPSTDLVSENVGKASTEAAPRGND
jgi:hypothetical protein